MRKSLKVDDARLEGITRAPFTASKKLYVAGKKYPSLRVPLREISLEDTKHADGKVTYHGHLKDGSIVVSVGDHVQCGQKIGESASSGNSSGSATGVSASPA